MFFGIFVRKTQKFQIFDSRDIYQCFDDIQDSKPIMNEEIKEDQGNFQAKWLIFDKQDKFVGLCSKE